MDQDKEDIWKFREVKNIREHLTSYINTRFDILKLSAIEIGAKIATAIVLGLLLLLFFTVFLIFISISAALAIGTALGSNALGFLIIGVVYILLGWLLYISRNGLILNPIVKILANMVQSNEDDTKDK